MSVSKAKSAFFFTSDTFLYSSLSTTTSTTTTSTITTTTTTTTTTTKVGVDKTEFTIFSTFILASFRLAFSHLHQA